MLTMKLTLTTLHGECDEDKVKKIWNEQMIRANIPEDQRGEAPGPDVVAVFREGEQVLQVRAETWDEARDLFTMSGRVVTLTVG